MHNIVLPYMKPHTDAATMVIYSMVIQLPWSLKPLFGICSDYILLGGYNKRYWLVLSLSCGAVGAVILFATSFTTSYVGPAAFIACGVAIHFQLSLYDLLTEGKYSEIRNANRDTGSDLSTLALAMHTIGSLVSVSFMGILSDQGLFSILFGIVLALSLSPLLPTLLGWLPEERHDTAKWVQVVDRSRLRERWKSIAVVAFCGIGGATCSAIVTLADAPIVALIISVVMLSICIGGSWRYMDPLITQVAMFQVLTAISQPSISSALDYYYTASPDCLADGPHFSYTYYFSYTGVVSIAINLAGMAVYVYALRRMRIRYVLLIPTVLRALAGMSDLIIVMRWNIALGIPDGVSYMLGQAIIEPLLGTLLHLPSTALIAMAAPKGEEASSFAFLAGIANFARMVSHLSGSVIIQAADVVACNFDSLAWLIVLCHIVSPMVVGIPAAWLVPNKRQDE